jgi:hypothetical protein
VVPVECTWHLHIREVLWNVLYCRLGERQFCPILLIRFLLSISTSRLFPRGASGSGAWGGGGGGWGVGGGGGGCKLTLKRGMNAGKLVNPSQGWGLYRIGIRIKRGFFCIFLFNTVSPAAPQNPLCRTQVSCDYGIGSQTL